MRFNHGEPFNEDFEDYRYLEKIEHDLERVDLDVLCEVELVDLNGDPVFEEEDEFENDPDFYDY